MQRRSAHAKNPTTRICEKSKYSKSVAPVTEYDETVIVKDIASMKKINTVVTNVASTASMDCHSKKVRDFAFSFISDHITTDYYYLLLLCKTKKYNKKWRITERRKFTLKIVRVIISMT